VTGDFTHLAKTGRQIPNVHGRREPMSPPFHVDLIYGLRFIQYLLLPPLYQNSADFDAAGAGGRRFYAKETFTPESVRTDESRP